MYKFGDHVEFRLEKDIWEAGRVYAILPDGVIAIYVGSIGNRLSDIYERQPEDVREIMNHEQVR